MDSYEYYLLYHDKRQNFLEMFSKDDKEILIALKQLAKNRKLNADSEIFFLKLLAFIENDVNLDFFLDELLQLLMSKDLFLKSFNILLENELTLAKTRIGKVFMDFALRNSIDDIKVQKFCDLLVENIFSDSSIRHFAIGILYETVKKSQKLKMNILNLLIDHSFKRNDTLSMENVCYFFKQLCQTDLKNDPYELLEKYFEDSTSHVKKQGIFLVKCLIEYKLLSGSRAENWKLFVTIIETLEENQSHLILPTLELLHDIKVDEDFEKFWFIICSMLINHENSLVKNFGLNYIFKTKNRKFKKEQILKILQGLNATYLYESCETDFIKKVQKFVEFNLEEVFYQLIDINWISIPFYYVLKFCNTKNILNISNSKEFTSCLEKQTEILPKRIRNIKIRGMVKEIYADILEKIWSSSEIVYILPILRNIFVISKSHHCLDKCLIHIKREDYELIFNDKYDYEFLKYLLIKTHIGRTVKEIKTSVSHLTNNKKIGLEVMCALNELGDEYDDKIPNLLIYETIESIWINLNDGQCEHLNDSLELLDIVLKASKTQIEYQVMDHLTEIWTKVNRIFETDQKYEYSYIKLTSIILKYNIKFDIQFVERTLFSPIKRTENLTIFTYCQAIFLRNLLINEKEMNIKYMKNILENIEILLDRASQSTDVYSIFEILQVLITEISNEVLMEEFKFILKSYIFVSSNIIDLTVEFWSSLLNLIWSLIGSSSQWIPKLRDVFGSFQEKVAGNNRFSMILAIFNFVKQTELPNNELSCFFKNTLTDAIFEVEIMTRDEQIENALIAQDVEISQKLKLRLEIAQLFNEKFSDEFHAIIENKILSLSDMNSKKIRYYPNSKVHRLKLRHFQPLIFCKMLNKDVIDVLIHELLWINNQLNVIYILEIILASQYKDIIKLLSNGNKELNAQALKSIFAIIIMQMRGEKDFEIAEKMLEEIFKNVFPFSMGQNFGVRIYSMLTIVLSYEHVKSLKDFKDTPIIFKIAEVCSIVLESVKQKNCLKYFSALKNDFRFKNNLNVLKKYQVIYGEIPLITKMPYDEIIFDENQHCENFLAADMIKEMDCIVMSEELEFQKEENSRSASVNLQRKYLPLKNQIPAENILRTLPEKFRIYDTNEGVLKPKSNLVVIASLIDNNTNLGGLARTSEIFGISKYVIHSLKSQDNFEFKTLSKTSEKWINISEVKEWQLFDYLLAMKQLGYTIAGAEQTSNSKSLLNVEFPEKCVFLLGNEKKGIPSDLLALLDLVVEIPQTGVVRSLNVHVAGAILMWEYAKQHTFKKFIS